MFFYTSKWRVKKRCSDSKTRKTESCLCPELVVLHQGSPAMEKRHRLVLISCCGCVLAITRGSSGAARRVNPPRFVHWGEPITCSLIPNLHQCFWLWDLTLLFLPLHVQVPLEAATCTAQDGRAAPLSCNETLPSSPRILLTKHLPPYQLLCVQTP